MSAETVYLRPITAADTSKIVTWRNKDFVRSNFIYQKLFTAEGHMTWLKEQVEPGHVVQFIICVKGAERSAADSLSDGAKARTEIGDREIGSVYLRDIDREAGTAEYGIFIGEEDALGRGYGTAAAKLMLAYGFEELGLKKIFLRFVDGNTGAWKSYEKAGFQMMDNIRENVNLEQGKRDVLFMETERSAWERANSLKTAQNCGKPC